MLDSFRPDAPVSATDTMTGQELRRVRRLLKLSQRQLALLLDLH